jgi:septum formation protein
MTRPSHAPRIILASQSPRRRDLLSLVGIPHEVRPADIDETLHPGETPEGHSVRLARGKVAAIAAREPRATIVGSDTIVVVDGVILGKPRDAAEARAMIARLSGRAHEVFTAVAVARGERVVDAVSRVEVTFRALADDEIAAYVETGEPMDKAGAYGIQGYGATIVERIDGDYFAVMGLPLVTVVRLLAAVGLRYEFGRVVESGNENREPGTGNR